MNRAGMTLIEVLVGLTVASMAMAAGYGAFASVTDHARRDEASTEDVRRAAAIRATLTGWIAGARVSIDDAGTQFRGFDGTLDNRPADEATFLTTYATPLGGTESLVRLYVDADSTTAEDGLSAEFSDSRTLAKRRMTIDARVRGLEMRYLANVGGAQHWYPSWVSSTVLPVAVEVTLLPAQGDSLPALLRRPLLVPIEAGR